jgi:hypothetical protein
MGLFEKLKFSKKRTTKNKGRQNMGFFEKLKFWKKRTTKTPTMEDGCVYAKDRRICDDAKVSMEPTVKVEYERELELKNQRIGKLEEDLAVSKQLAADLMLTLRSVEEQVRKYAEMPVTSRCDDCECKKQVPASTDLCEKNIITDLDDKKSNPEKTSGRSTEFDGETPKEAKGGQTDCANADEQETKRRVSVLVEEIRKLCVELICCKKLLLASLSREALLHRNFWNCYLKPDQPLNSSSGGGGGKSSGGGGGGGCLQ